jgi:hypothetical protein
MGPCLTRACGEVREYLPALGSNANPFSPRYLAELSSMFLVRALMSSSFTPFGFFTGVSVP